MIVITTMEELPEYCYDCPCHGENGQCYADEQKRYSLEYRPFWCPLKQIEPEEKLRVLEYGDQDTLMPAT